MHTRPSERLSAGMSSINARDEVISPTEVGNEMEGPSLVTQIRTMQALLADREALILDMQAAVDVLLASSSSQYAELEAAAEQRQQHEQQLQSLRDEHELHRQQHEQQQHQLEQEMHLLKQEYMYQQQHLDHTLQEQEEKHEEQQQLQQQLHQQQLDQALQLLRQEHLHQQQLLQQQVREQLQEQLHLKQQLQEQQQLQQQLQQEHEQNLRQHHAELEAAAEQRHQHQLQQLLQQQLIEQQEEQQRQQQEHAQRLLEQQEAMQMEHLQQQQQLEEQHQLALDAASDQYDQLSLALDETKAGHALALAEAERRVATTSATLSALLDARDKRLAQTEAEWRAEGRRHATERREGLQDGREQWVTPAALPPPTPLVPFAPASTFTPGPGGSMAGRVALVTGCGSAEGIGLAIARSLAAAGARVAITSTTSRIFGRLAEMEGGEGGESKAVGPTPASAASSSSSAVAAAAAAAAAGSACSYRLGRRHGAFVADLTREGEARALLEGVRQTMGPVDVLINNAGMVQTWSGGAGVGVGAGDDGVGGDGGSVGGVPSPGGIPLHLLSLAQWRHDLDINLTTAFLASRQALPSMLERGYGKIVMVSSTTGAVNAFRGARGYRWVSALRELRLWAHGCFTSSLSTARDSQFFLISNHRTLTSKMCT